MGCEKSNLNNNPSLLRCESLSVEEELQLHYKQLIQSSRGEILSLYHFSSIIHRGPDSIVRKVLERSTRSPRICKIIPIDKSTGLSRLRQVQILKNLNHPNIVQIIEYFLEKSFLYIIMEQIPGKTLLNLYFENQILQLWKILEIVKQILIALRFCHSKSIAHAAINPENIILVKIKENDTFLIKLVGFSEANVFGQKQRKSIELFNKENIFNPPQGNTFAQKKDIWACGIILLELLSGQRKFTNFLQNKNEIVKRTAQSLDLDKQTRLQIADLLSNLLQFTPQKRVTAEMALNHPLFNNDTIEKRVCVKKNNTEVMKKIMKFRLQNNIKSIFSIYASLNYLSVYDKTQNVMEFYNLDKNKDGKLDFQELVEALKNSFNMSEQEAVQSVNKIFQNVDETHPKSLEYFEYVMATSLISKQVSEASLRKMFDQIDANKDGEITEDQLKNVIEGVESYNLMKSQQRITFDDFKGIMFSIFDLNCTS